MFTFRIFCVFKVKLRRCLYLHFWVDFSCLEQVCHSGITDLDTNHQNMPQLHVNMLYNLTIILHGWLNRFFWADFLCVELSGHCLESTLLKKKKKSGNIKCGLIKHCSLIKFPPVFEWNLMQHKSEQEVKNAVYTIMVNMLIQMRKSQRFK